MRYVKTENTILAGNLLSSSVVKIKLINMTTDELLAINSNTCNESTHIPGTYLWNTNNISSTVFENLTTPINVLYMMYIESDITKNFKGKFVVGGEFNNLTTITNIDNQVKTNAQISSINQTELKTILNDTTTGLPKLLSNSESQLNGISNIGLKIDNNFALSNNNLSAIKSLVLRRKIVFASSI